MSEPEFTDRIDRLEDLLSDVLEHLASPRPPEPLLSVDGVATRLGVSRRTVETLISIGELKPIRIKGSRRFDPKVIEAYIRRCAEKRDRRRVRTL